MSRFGSASGWVGARSWLLRAGAAALVVSVPAVAADWSLKFGASESLSLNDNIDLTETERDAALATSTSINFDLLAKARTYELEFSPVLGLSRTFFTQTPDDWSHLPSATLAYRKFTKLTDYDLSASFARTEASSDELLDGIISTNEGDQLTYTVGATATHRVNRRNTLIWANTASLVDFTIPSDDLVPYVDFNSTGTWRRQLTERADADLSAGVEYYDPDSDVDSAAIAYRSGVGLNARLSGRLSVNGRVGIVAWDPEDSGLTLGPTFNVAAAYKLKETSYALSAGLDLSPDKDGELHNALSSSVSVSHQVNDLLNLGAAATYAYQFPDGEPDASVFTISPSLNYRLSEDWTSGLSYKYVQSDDAGILAHSNAVTLTLSYGTVLLP